VGTSQAPRKDIIHGQGLFRGAPLSPLLLYITIDPLQQILEMAMDFGILYVLLGRTHGLRVSMHATDATIFLTPSDQDVINLTF
jgi:hypothetical protein